MTIEAKVIKHSIHAGRVPLLSIQCRYPKFIHGEVMTHRVFSRNASSSRAIPVERLIDDVIRDTARPLYWFKNKPGMQGTELCDSVETSDLNVLWDAGRDRAIELAKAMIKINAHKQHINRILEPYSHINVLITATNWRNFYTLRDHKDAQPEIRLLAQRIKEVVDASVPEYLEQDRWHLPYVHDKEWAFYPLEILRKLSVARCARVSYLTHDNKEPDIEKDLKLYEQLVVAEPLHASPAEHQASADPNYVDPDQWGNFYQWRQLRKMFPNECAKEDWQ